MPFSTIREVNIAVGRLALIPARPFFIILERRSARIGRKDQEQVMIAILLALSYFSTAIIAGWFGSFTNVLSFVIGGIS